jgi:hypothetical protein
MLTTASSARRFYQGLWRLESDAETSPYLNGGNPLPPFLCRRLAFGDPVVDLECGWVEAMTGNAQSAVEVIDAGGHRLHYCSSGISPRIFEILPIDGHGVIALTHRRKDILSRALSLLAALDDNARSIDIVSDFTGMLLWVASDRPDGLTSSSFPQLPHLSLITDHVLRILLPNTLTESDSTWALAEDLVHEALHQQLSATMLEHDVFTDNYDAATGPRIKIYWRDETWTLDRAVHALHVYSGVVRLRNEALQGSVLSDDDRRLVEQALPGARSAMAFLRDAVPKHAHFFTDQGRALLTEICRPA